MFYDLKATSLQGKPINFSDFKDKVVLIVNTASECGFTYQYEGLQKLHEEYANKGLVIIGFPCNQFGNQEPGDAGTIQQGCLINYGVDFLISEKVDVNGENAHPVFQYLKSKKTGFFGKNIKWNFTKFLINRHGEVESRFAPVTKPQAIANKIEKLL
ncbi:glutathione peroxidase [Pseudoalteromonas phenolica]|uniref:Glutathione peroxidase n=1 Tax=Pseudoalteromonas phenolica TaxID=161398 RepID=A0A0S2K7X6_9GAMM|nr:glutathione peroxidase [Pseudoalteromonas phenolica]ALO44245.1 Glutathione peroxidase [Pseudoalteromonas phenolica]MBE0357239.1 glutathione peroxidase [Pseudoalteromonas phenolica O-BC30]RXF03565.1 glutathione peroxidase [Pseudoalteromonas phenolica O-BC30]TMO56438.1 glutathione peroxidase [Pseudoalteromonas phenolica]